MNNVIPLRHMENSVGNRAAVLEAPQSLPFDEAHDAYSLSRAAELCGIPLPRLRSWARRGFLPPSLQKGKRFYYRFSDLVSLRTAWQLVQKGVAPQRLRSSVAALKSYLPMIDHPLSQLRIVADGRDILVQEDERAYEASSGQYVFDWQQETLAIGLTSSHKEAYRWYLEGVCLEEHGDSPRRAEQAYVKALSLDAELAPAWIALGHIAYRRGEITKSKHYYESALQIAANIPEAYYGVGCVLFEEGDLHGAAGHFLQAIEIDPAFAEAHLNAAMSLEDLKCSQAAKPHWQAYIELEPDGLWVDIARRHIEKNPL